MSLSESDPHNQPVQIIQQSPSNNNNENNNIAHHHIIHQQQQQQQQLEEEEGQQHINGDYKDNGSPTNESKEDGAYDPTNLIVNYIPVSVTEDSLRQLFQSYGPIERVKIVNDKFTGFSLGYGFVKYSNIESAQSAVTALNGHQLQNKRLKVSVSKPPEREKKTNLYISGLPAHWSQTELEQLVSPYGRVLEVRVLYDLNTRKCKGVGFARFESQKSAITAINALTGTTVDGGIMPLIVKYADTTNDKVRKAMANGYSPINTTNNNIPPALNHNNSQQNQQFRPMNNAPHTQQQPFYFAAAAAQQAQGINLYNPALQAQQAALLQQQQAAQAAQAQQAAAVVVQQQQQNNPVTGHNPIPGQQAVQQEFTGVCLFVYHLPLEATESTLFQLFGNYGVVTSAKVMRDLLTSRSKGFGFVNLLTEQQAQAAINGLNGFQLGSKYLKVAFKK